MAAVSSPKRERGLQGSQLHCVAPLAIIVILLLAVTYGLMYWSMRKDGLEVKYLGASSPASLQNHHHQQQQLLDTSTYTAGAAESNLEPANPSLARLRQSMVASSTVATSGYKELKRHPICSFLEAGAQTWQNCPHR